MDGLSELSLDISYRSDTGNVVADFYVPCLQRCSLYRRAAGYFSSSGLTLAAKGLAHLVKTGGSVRLVVSPQLSDEDINAIQSGYKSRDEVLRDAARQALSEAENELAKNRLSALAWLIANGALDIKLALRTDPHTNKLSRGIYHEKIGIFSDDWRNHVAFTGSGNETVGGLITNFESVDVFCSWMDPHLRVARKAADFDRLWSDNTDGLVVLNFNEATRELLEKYKTKEPPEFDLEEISIPLPRRSRPRPSAPSAITLRPYQNKAISAWFENDGAGILQMATGTGKTITALAAAAKLSDQIGLQALIIVCPYKHLVTQWKKECALFGIVPLLAFEARTQWIDELTQRLSEINRDPKAFLCVVTTNKTFATDAFQQRIQYFPRKTMLIVDEVHNIGSSGLASRLPPSISLRLGLSATPERWFDDEGTGRLLGYFGKILEPRLGIREAIDIGALTPYRYYPILVELTDAEREQYLDLSAKIARLYSSDTEATESNPVLDALLLQRARLIGAAANKLVALRDVGKSHLHATHMLFYCGDGQVESVIDDTFRRQIDEVTKILGSELGLRVAQYTAETDLDEREALRDEIASGRIQGLIAIRCLDEGVDIPSVQMAVILASSTNPRQFVQRRGRVLRRSEGKTHADIYDMIVVPPKEARGSPSEKSMLRRELERFAEFADISLNAGEARAVVFQLQKTFNLMDL